MAKHIETLGDRIFVRMRLDMPATIRWNDDRGWAKLAQHGEEAKRFDCRILGTHRRRDDPRLFERMHGGDPLIFREVLLRQNGRQTLVNWILGEHDRPLRF